MKSIISGIALIGTLSLLSSTAFAVEDGAKTRLVLDLDDCVRIALRAAPELGEAQADIDHTSSKLDEAKSFRYPQIEVLTLFGPAPPARRQDVSPIVASDKTFKFNELTWFSSADATIIQPLYTFGKISGNMKAATHGIEVDRSRKDQRANEVVLKVREYYFGLLLARELKEVVLEVQETLHKARDKAQKMLDAGTSGVEEIDMFKLAAFSGEVAKYLEEAKKGENLALDALKTRLGLPMSAQFEISGERLTLDEVLTPEFEVYVGKARARRPEFRQIAEGLKARSALLEAAQANYYPDIFLGGLVSWAYADDRDRIRNPYINDQFRHLIGGVALGARWKLDFGITGARVAAERAQYNRLLSTKEFADANIPLQIRKHYLDLKEAESSAMASKSAYGNAKKWAITAVANFDFGLGPAKEILEALQAYARMRAAYFQSIYNYQIARINLDYATGEPPLKTSKSFMPVVPETPNAATPTSVDPLPEKDTAPQKSNIPATKPVVMIPDPARNTEQADSIAATKVDPVNFAVARPYRSYSVVNDISIDDSCIEIHTNTRILNYRQTRLSAPDRLAIDIPGAECTIPSQTASVRRFGIESIRIGCHPDNVRIVLDFASAKYPAYEITTTARGLRVSTTQ
ncbi:MAG: TolC family protein [Desulfuromonadales bacterium]